MHSLTRSLDGVLQLERICDTTAQGMISVCKQRQFDPDGNVTHERHTFYDALTRPVHDLEYEDGILSELAQYHYGDHGLTRKEVLLPDSTLIYVTEYTHDANGHLVEDLGTTSDVDSTGQRFYYTDRTYTYRNDTTGREVERSYIVEGKVLTRCYSTYDDNGNYVEFKVCDPDGGLRSKDEFTYDKNGNVIIISHTDGISVTGRSTKTYDNRGNTLRIINSRNGKDADVITFAYEFYAH